MLPTVAIHSLVPSLPHCRGFLASCNPCLLVHLIEQVFAPLPAAAVDGAGVQVFAPMSAAEADGAYVCTPALPAQLPLPPLLKAQLTALQCGVLCTADGLCGCCNSQISLRMLPEVSWKNLLLRTTLPAAAVATTPAAPASTRGAKKFAAKHCSKHDTADAMRVWIQEVPATMAACNRER
jgi:hypothetical protein